MHVWLSKCLCYCYVSKEQRSRMKGKQKSQLEQEVTKLEAILLFTIYKQVISAGDIKN